MTTTLRHVAPTASSLEDAPSIPIDGLSSGTARPLDVIILESCHCTWIFDPARQKFCRILKGIEVGNRFVATAWRSYSQVEPDTHSEGFTVYLNEAHTRLIRSWRHTENCRECGERERAALTLDDIEQTLDRHHARCDERSALR